MDPELAKAIGILAIALLLDYIVGEFAPRWHPVVWMGKLISLLLKAAPKSGWWPQFVFGLVVALSVPALSAAVAILAYHYSLLLFGLNWFVGAVLLKSSFALRELGAAAERVRAPLSIGDLPSARQSLRSLCSRDPSELDEEALLAAAVQSLAENLSDSFVAPLFYYVLFGIPGAVAYRAINTLDSMIGYRGQYEALGKAAAIFDDIANFIPARLTAFLLLLAGLFSGRNVASGRRIFWRDRSKTPSPNGGRPMSMMAGLLGVRLEKKGAYVLGEPMRPLTPDTVTKAWCLATIASCFTVAFSAVGLIAIHILCHR